MKRRQFIAGLSSTVLTWPLAARELTQLRREWPDTDTTGYGNTKLAPASSNGITESGIYTGLHFTGAVAIMASDVTLSNCLVTNVNADYWGIVTRGRLSNIVIENCEIAGAGLSGKLGAYGVYIYDDCEVTIRACNIHDCGSSVAITDGRITIKDCYFHDFNSGDGTHYNGIQFNGSGSPNIALNIQHNYIHNQRTWTDCIMIDNQFGPVSNVVINNNILIGGAYTLYVDGNFNTNPITNVVITNNYVRAGSAGFMLLRSGGGIYQVTHFGNFNYITGLRID